MSAHTLRALASAGALCGWLAGHAPHAAAQEAGPSAASQGESAASRLVIRIEDKWAFQLGNSRHADETLVDGGEVQSTFRCDGGFASPAAFDDATMAVRKLQLARNAPSGSSSLLAGLRPLAGGWSSGGSREDDAQEVSITNARLRVVASEGSEGGQLASPMLDARLSQPLPNGTTLEVPRYGEAPASLAVEYDCLQQGRATVELRLQVVGGDRSLSRDLCLRWAKACEMGWRNLEISHGGTEAFKGGQVNSEWLAAMNEEGTHETVTKLRLSSPGIQRLRPPRVESSQQLLKVELRPYYFGDGDDESFEVTSDPVQVSVVYNCVSDGRAEVSLTLEKASLSEAHAPESVTLRWHKQCGATTYRHLQIFLKSDQQKNQTQAVSNGDVLPGFMRPCRSPRKGAGPSPAPPAAGAADAACEAGPLAFEVPPRERRTTLELRVDRDVNFDPPSLQPPPDLSYDRRVLQAMLVQSPRSSSGGKQVGQKKAVQSLNIKYTCFKEGVSTVMVTLHVLAHKPIDLAWRKRCVEPKVHVGKALTAPQAIVITMFVCGIIAVVCCLIFYFCGQDDRSLEYDGMPNGAGKAARDVELAGRRPRPNRFGMVEDRLEEAEEEEEVTFHG